MTKVLVTGGAGFIGSHVVDSLIAHGYQVAVVDNLFSGQKNNINSRAEFHHMDIRNSSLVGLIQSGGFSHVFHLAAQVDVQRSLLDPQEDASINICGTLNVLEGCQLGKVRKVIFSSSAAVYGMPDTIPTPENHQLAPLSVYGASKVAAEIYLAMYKENHGLDYVSLRYSNVYGPRQNPVGEGGVVHNFLESMSAGHSPVIYGDGNQTRDFVYVGDVSRSNLLAMEAGSGEVINIATEKPVSVNELYSICASLCQFDRSAEQRPAKPGEIYHSVLSNNKAMQQLGWQPETDIAEGLKLTFSCKS